MLICARPQMMSLRYSMDEIIPMFREAGFDGFEFCLEDKLFHVRPDMLEDYSVSHVAGLAEENGLRISAVGCHVNFVSDDNVYAVVRKAVEKTRRFGTDIFIATSGQRSGTGGDTSGYDEMKLRLAELVRIASACGVRIALEPEPGHWIDTTASFLDLAGEFDDPPALCCNFDIGHSHLLDPDIGGSIRLLGDRIIHGHIENIAGGVHRHLVPWEGEIDLPEVLQDLSSIRFAGPLAFDFYSESYPEVMPHVARYLKGILPAGQSGGMCRM